MRPVARCLILRRLLTLALALCVLTLGLAGCLGYQAGSPNGSTYRRVFVPVVENRSPAPQLRALLTDQLRRQLADDSRVLVVATEDAAQANLQVVIENYQRVGVASAANDTGRDTAFRLVVQARISLIGDEGTADLKDVIVEAETLAFTAPNLVDAEAQAAGTLASELARRIRDRVLGSW